MWTESAWWLAAGFDHKRWVFFTPNEPAKCLLKCSNDKMNLEARKVLFEAARIGTPFEASSVETLDEAIAKRVKEELLESAILEVWKGFHEVPDVRIPRLPSALALTKARPSDWKHLHDAVLGQENLNIHDWKSFTDIHPLEARTSPVVIWFWEFVETLTPDDKFKLFFWWTSYRVLPNGGWRKMPQRLQINIKSDTTRLPVAHTCSFEIDLPSYTHFASLSEKLKLAMSELGFWNV